jgi:2'-5' RNA ligase
LIWVVTEVEVRCRRHLPSSLWSNPDMRLFLAINFSSEIRNRLWEAFVPVRNASFPLRWVSPELIHLTVKFLGDVDEQRLPEIAAGVQSACRGARGFDLLVSGVGSFPNSRNPKVVFADCEPSPPLEILQDHIERAMSDLGFALEGRAFRPHLTLARARRGALKDSWSGLNRITAGVRFNEVAHVTSVEVMESRLRPSGPQYSVRNSIPLEV